MIRICDIPNQLATVLLILLFLAALSEFVLILLYKLSYNGRSWHILPGCCMAALLFILSCLCDTAPGACTVPVLPVAAALLAALIHIPIEVAYCIKHRNDSLSSYAIKEATDDLPTGVCFADQTGRIVLCNRRMGELSSALIGSYPQTLEELDDALRSTGKDSAISRISDEPVLYRFPDGSVWRFRYAELPDGFRQLIAQDVTALHEANETLRSDNEELQKVNVKLKRMYARLADRIREQEILDLKMRIHDNIGASLIAVSDMMNREADGDMDQQLSILQDAVSYLFDDRPAAQGTFEEARQKAAAMKVSLVLKGSIPQNTTAESVIVAAVRECVTNCVNHAKGNRVTVEITEHLDIWHITITNNGEPPKGKIVEGGGLSNLRKSVEAAGGEMDTSNIPVFTLILNLPRKEQEL